MAKTNISTYASNKILNMLLGRETFTIPATYSVALSSDPLGDNGVGLKEPTDDANYKRLQITNNKTFFTTASNKTVKISKELIFAESSKNWARMTHFSILDASNNVWFYGELHHSLDIEIETSAIMEANTNSFSLDIVDGSTPDMSLTTAVANRILNYIFGSVAITIPTNFYFGVSSTPLSIEGVGMTEPVGASGYSRLVIPNNKTSFTTATAKVISIAKEFRFATSDVSWGKMTHYFISESATGENVWWCGKLIHSRNVEIGTTLLIKPGNFSWKLDSVETIAPILG